MLITGFSAGIERNVFLSAHSNLHPHNMGELLYPWSQEDYLTNPLDLVFWTISECLIEDADNVCDSWVWKVL